MLSETTHSIKQVVQHLEHFFPAERSVPGIRKNLISAAAENMHVDKRESLIGQLIWVRDFTITDTGR